MTYATAVHRAVGATLATAAVCLAVGASAAVAGAPDPERNATVPPAGTGGHGLSADQVKQRYDRHGDRIVDLEVQTTSPLRFAVATVRNQRRLRARLVLVPRPDRGAAQAKIDDKNGAPHRPRDVRRGRWQPPVRRRDGRNTGSGREELALVPRDQRRHAQGQVEGARVAAHRPRELQRRRRHEVRRGDDPQRGRRQGRVVVLAQRAAVDGAEQRDVERCAHVQSRPPAQRPLQRDPDQAKGRILGVRGERRCAPRRRLRVPERGPDRRPRHVRRRRPAALHRRHQRQRRSVQRARARPGSPVDAPAQLALRDVGQAGRRCRSA